jgi:hypothetical protein
LASGSGRLTRAARYDGLSPDAAHATSSFLRTKDPSLAGAGWYPRLEDYVYVALTNAIAFSPTDAMLLRRSAKRRMALESMTSVAAVLLNAARAVNVLRS